MEKSIYTAECALLRETLRVARESVGLTQTDVATKLGVTQTFVSKCERGERRLDVIELRNWCRALGMTLGEVVEKLEAAIADSTPTE